MIKVTLDNLPADFMQGIEAKQVIKEVEERIINGEHHTEYICRSVAKDKAIADKAMEMMPEALLLLGKV